MAAKIILDRVMPPAKERPVHVDLPDTSTSEGVSAAQNAILQAVATGELLPGEASTLSTIVEAKRRAIENNIGKLRQTSPDAQAREWVRGAGETEQDFKDRASREATRNAWGFAMLLQCD